MEAIDGVFDVGIMNDDEGNKINTIKYYNDIIILLIMHAVPTTKCSSDPNYCVFKFVVWDQAGTIVTALNIFFVRLLILMIKFFS